jgi:hypothetical protein
VSLRNYIHALSNLLLLDRKAQPSGQGGREATLAAALLSRKQLQEAARWLTDEDEAMDAEIQARQVKPEVARTSKFHFRAPPSQSGDSGGFGPRSTAKFPPPTPSSAIKDDSALATGYNRKIIEQRGCRELKSGLGVNI